MRYDIHTHTTYSDGRLDVHEQVRAAEAMALDYLAITDHCHSDAPLADPAVFDQTSKTSSANNSARPSRCSRGWKRRS